MLPKTSLLFSLLLVFSILAEAQHKSTLAEITAERDAYFDSLPDKFARGTGIKQYERWKYYWEQRISESDTIPSAPQYFKYIHNAVKEAGLKNVFSSEAVSHKTHATLVGNWVNLGIDSSDSGYEGIGRLMCMGFDPTNSATFYVGAPAGGLWKTTNFGQTWTPLSDFLPQIGISGIVVDPVNPNIIYIATGDPDATDNRSIGVLKSYDAGMTWQTTGLTFPISVGAQAVKLIMDPDNHLKLILATRNGMYVTTDSANTWTAVLPTGNYRDVEYHKTNHNIVYAIQVTGSDCLFRKSTDGGQTWPITTTFSGARRANMAVCPADSDLVQVVCVKSDYSLQRMYKSTDAGNSFTGYADPQNTGVNLLSYNVSGSGSGGQGWYDLIIAIDPQNPNHVTVGGINIWDSYNGGATWNISTHWYGANGIDEVHADQHYTTYHPLLPHIQFALNDGGIYYRDFSLVNHNFTDITKGLSINQIYKFDAVDKPNEIILSGLQDNGTKLKKNGLWRAATGGDGGESEIDQHDNNFMYAEYVYGTVYRSNDQFVNNRTTISNALPNPGTGAWITPFRLDPKHSNIIMIAYADLFWSDDRGNSFSQLSNLNLSREMRALAVTAADSSVVMMTNNDVVAITYDLFSTTWTLLNASNVNQHGLPLNNLNCNDIRLDQKNAARAIAVFGGFTAGNKIYLTIDSGKTWSNISSGIPNVPVLCAELDTFSNHGIYVGCEVGVYYKNDTMSSFIPFSNQLPNSPVTDLKLIYSRNKIMASTYGRGMWESDLYSKVNNLMISPLGSLCENTNNTMVADGLNSFASVNYKWYINGQLASSSNSNFFQYSGLQSGDSITCTATLNGTTYNSNTFHVTLLANPTPVISNLSTFVLQSNIADGNQWYQNNQAVAGQVSQNFNVTSGGNFYTIVTQANGCISDTSNSLRVWPESIDQPHVDIANVNGPDPNGIVLITLNTLLPNISFELIDINGKKIQQGEINQMTTTLDISYISSGSYLLKIEWENGMKTFKLVK